jgi:hypothetical protein
MRDSRVWLEQGIVKKLPGEASHFRQDGGEIIVAVELQPALVHLEARLGYTCGVAGVFIIPDDGDEVLVGMPDGEAAGDPMIVGLLGAAPSGLQPRKVYVKGPEVLVFDTATGSAKALALKSDVEEVRGKFNGHTHADPSSGFTGGPLDGAHAPISVNAPAGTTVLKGQ